MKELNLLLHLFLHLLLILALIKLLNLDIISILFAILGGVFPEIDHLPLIRQIGIGGLFYLWQRVWLIKFIKYKLHNLKMMVIFLCGILFTLTNWSFYLGIFSISAFLHLLLDFLWETKVLKIDKERWI